MKLYFKYLSLLLRSQMEYRASFLLLTIGQFFVPFFTFIAILMFFQRFPTVGGWSLYEVALCYGITHMAFAISECLARGFDSFSSLVINGDFDRILLRPRSTVLQMMGSKFEFTRIGRLLQSLIVLYYGMANINVNWNPYKVITLLLMILGGVALFIGIYILGATLCFWTLEGLEVVNIFTDGGREMTQYPLSIYKEWLRKFFTFVIPFGAVNYLPLMYILDKNGATSNLNMLVPLSGVLFILPCLIVWRFGVKHYKSSGS